MDIDLTTLSANHRYKLLTALVIPRPIAWVTTKNENGTVNAAPYSFFNVLGNRPPIVALGPSMKDDGSPKDTLRNIEREKEFVVNLVHREIAELMHNTAAPYAAETSEINALSIETEPASRISTPRIKASKVKLECRHWGTVAIEDNRVVFGIVEHMHVEDGMIDPENYHLRPGAFDGVGRLQGPGWYCTSSDRFDLGRFPPPPDKA